MNVGELIKTKRNAKGYTLRKLKEITGLSVSFISDIENGRKTPSTESAKKLSEALDIDIKLLVNDKVSNLISEITLEEETITNPNIRAIARAGKHLTDEEAEELKRFAERLFPDAFKK